MVRITKVYTRQGDQGSTRLAGGRKIAKTAPRIEAYGTVDELNACLGLAAEAMRGEPRLAVLLERVLAIQNELFDLGSQLAVLPADRRPDTPLITAARVARLEREIDEMNAGVEPLRSFILPGGGEVAARLHLARTVCRRAEREVLRLGAVEALDGIEVPYVNRLGDWLFVAARAAGAKLDAPELLWRPGATALALALAMALTLAVTAAASPPPSFSTAESDCALPDFRFASGETLPELRLHVTTLGTPRRDPSGVVRNAVLILHGTSGNGGGFLSGQFGGQLFRAGQLLDAARYYIILPDGIGHGKSSRPSDGLHMRFPKYTYDDMVRADHQLLTQCLGVDHLRLVMGTSMGGMHTWVWGTTYPDFMDALMPLASLPVEIAGRNRMLRKMAIDAITGDPEWRGGEYKTQPRGLVSAIHVMIFMVSSPLQWQREAPTRQQAEGLLDRLIQHYAALLDANDLIYQFEASRDYNPLPHLGAIRAPLYAVNSADDQVNPPELGILDAAIHHVPRGRYILLPITSQTRGHGTHSLPAIWGKHLAELLAESDGGAPRAGR
jgi:homoserine O-acetyltransferase